MKPTPQIGDTVTLKHTPSVVFTVQDLFTTEAYLAAADVLCTLGDNISFKAGTVYPLLLADLCLVQKPVAQNITCCHCRKVAPRSASVGITSPWGENWVCPDCLTTHDDPLAVPLAIALGKGTPDGFQHKD